MLWNYERGKKGINFIESHKPLICQQKEKNNITIIWMRRNKKRPRLITGNSVRGLDGAFPLHSPPPPTHQTGDGVAGGPPLWGTMSFHWLIWLLTLNWYSISLQLLRGRWKDVRKRQLKKDVRDSRVGHGSRPPPLRYF